ncbi:lysozyme inhibitor LprI family protein [Vibrio campbellii]|uniref:lysozyme inhibitor LprI family protein n=1 Tax=Vibrio campbellii TaxID=680 RepID=UPI004056C22F
MKVSNILVVLTMSFFTVGASAASPSFDCNNDSLSGAEQAICQSEMLSQLDRQMSEVYKKAKAVDDKQAGQHTLKAEQVGWIRGRNECWKSNDEEQCLKQEYEYRIAELQTRYRLVGNFGAEFYACDGNKAKEVVLTRYMTDPTTLMAEFGDSSVFMAASDKDGLFLGRNEKVQYEDEGMVAVQWGYEAPLMKCNLRD